MEGNVKPEKRVLNLLQYIVDIGSGILTRTFIRHTQDNYMTKTEHHDLKLAYIYSRVYHCLGI